MLYDKHYFMFSYYFSSIVNNLLPSGVHLATQHETVRPGTMEKPLNRLERSDMGLFERRCLGLLQYLITSVSGVCWVLEVRNNSDLTVKFSGK